MVVMLLWLALFLQPAAPPSYEWTVPDPVHGAGVVTWQGPGALVKQRGWSEWQIDYSEDSAVRRVVVPGLPPVDIAWWPYPGDRYCIREAGTGALLGCTTVPLPYQTRVWSPVMLNG